LTDENRARRKGREHIEALPELFLMDPDHDARIGSQRIGVHRSDEDRVGNGIRAGYASERPRLERWPQAAFEEKAAHFFRRNGSVRNREHYRLVALNPDNQGIE